MKTECIKKYSSFQALGRREIVADFNGGDISSDGGGLHLREVEKRTGILERFARCFIDHRDQDLIEHSVLWALLLAMKILMTMIFLPVIS